VALAAAMALCMSADASAADTTVEVISPMAGVAEPVGLDPAAGLVVELGTESGSELELQSEPQLELELELEIELELTEPVRATWSISSVSTSMKAITGPATISLAARSVGLLTKG